MKKYVCLLLMFQLCNACLKAQEVVDTMYLFCQYKAQTIKLTAQKKMNDLIRLEIGKKISKSYSYETCLFDSASLAPNHSKELVKSITEARRQGGEDWLERAFAPFPKLRETATVYKNHPKGKITVLDRIDKTEYSYIDDLNSQEWKLETDTMTILGYLCYKAVCQWRGREYEAWYTPDIPVSEGPLKFGGLPGLIMKVGDSLQEWVYEIEGLENVNRPITMRPPLRQKKYEKTTRMKFLRGFRRFLNNLGSFADAMSDTPLGIKAGAGDKYDLMERDY